VGTDELKAAGLAGREIEELAEKLEAPEHPDFELDLAAMKTGDEIAAKMSMAVPNTFE